MKGIYLLALAIIFVVILGVLFYVNNSNFHVYVNPYSLTYVNQQNGIVILKLNVTTVNGGILPMSANLNIMIGVQVSEGKFGKPEYFSNSTSVNLGPLSKKSVILTYYLPNTILYFNSLTIEGSGYYNYKLYNTSTVNLINTLTNLLKIAIKYSNTIPYTTNYSTNTVFTTSTPFQIYPVIITVYSNNSVTTQLYLFLYPRIANGSYTLTIFLNKSVVYTSTISIPYKEKYIPIHIATTPPLLNNRYTANVAIILKNSTVYHYINFTLIYP